MTKMAMDEPQINDLVCVGRHGKPMKVLTVRPISRTALVENNAGVRFTVDWADMHDRWRVFLKESWMRDEAPVIPLW